MLSLLRIGVILAAAVIALVPLPREAVERLYARAAYPLVQPRLTALSNASPFAWFDAIVVLVAAVIVVMWVVRVRWWRAGVLTTFAWLVVDTTAIAAVLYLWFLAAWGLNYQREPLSAQLDFQEERITPEALRTLARRTVESLNALHGPAHAAPWPEWRDMRREIEPAFLIAQRDLAMIWRAEPAVPKPSVFNFYFTRVSIDGMTDPFFLETLANQHLLPFERVATVAHEWSHLAGYANEAEASFLGWLVCTRGSASAQYSGWLSLYGSVMNALPPSDRDEILRALGPGPREDLRAIAERVQRDTLPIARRTGFALYDRFLKANRVEAGVRSYGEVVRLLLGTRFDERGAPLLKR